MMMECLLSRRTVKHSCWHGSGPPRITAGTTTSPPRSCCRGCITGGTVTIGGMTRRLLCGRLLRWLRCVGSWGGGGHRVGPQPFELARLFA